jgi:hypothetical protein
MPYSHTRRKSTQWVTIVSIVLLLLFIAAFWQEIWGVLSLLFYLGVRLLAPELAAPADSLQHVLPILFNCVFGFSGVFVLWLLLISARAILPVRIHRTYDGYERNPTRPIPDPAGRGAAAPAPIENSFLFEWTETLKETLLVAVHFLLFMFNEHGPAVIIKGGKIKGTQEELDKSLPGVAVVDAHSAIVIDEKEPQPRLEEPFWQALSSVLLPLSQRTRFQPSRAVGPGIAFLSRNERIRGAVDLRKQFRLRPNVTSYTRDGIEVYGNVWSIFSIGIDPEVLNVSYDGDQNPANLRILHLEPVNGGQLKVLSLENSLDFDDRREIDHFYRIDSRNRNYEPYRPLSEPNRVPAFDPYRVFAALSSQARTDDDNFLPWEDLPAKVAAEMYRDLLLEINYDELFEEGQQGGIRLKDFKAAFRAKMRNLSMLSYRVVRHRFNAPLVPGHVYRASELMLTPVRPLTTAKPLRSRGIKIILSGFSDLSPVSTRVTEQRVDQWSAPWEKDVMFVRSRNELQAMELRAQEHADAQAGIITQLLNILESQKYTEEIMAIRLLQALESAAAEPETRKLLPRNTIQLMRTFHDWLLPENPSPLPPELEDLL